MKNLAYRETEYINLPEPSCVLCKGIGVFFDKKGTKATYTLVCPCVKTHTYITRYYYDDDQMLCVEQE